MRTAAAYEEVRDVVSGVLDRVGAHLSGTSPFRDAVVRSLPLLDAAARERAARAEERTAFAAVFGRWCRAARDLGRPVPLADLVAVQTGAIATAVTRIRDARPA